MNVEGEKMNLGKKMRLILAVALVGAALVGVSAEARPNFNDPVEVTGKLSVSGDDFFVEGYKLKMDDIDRVVVGDLNGDGKKRSIEVELVSMVGQSVTVKGFRDNRPEETKYLHVLEIDGKKFPYPRR
jgi:hypothetical protein